MIEGGELRLAGSQVLDSWGVAQDRVVVVKPSELNTWTVNGSERVGFRPGSLIATANSSSLLGYSLGNAHLISNEHQSGTQRDRWLRGERYLFTTATMVCLGYNVSRIKIVDSKEAGIHTLSSNQHSTLGWNDCNNYPNGAILVDDASPNNKTWILANGKKRLFKDVSVVESWGAKADALKTSKGIAQLGIPNTTGTKLGYRIGTVLRINNPIRRWVIVPRPWDYAAGKKHNFVGTFADCYEYPLQIVPEQASYVNELHPIDGDNMPC